MNDYTSSSNGIDVLRGAWETVWNAVTGFLPNLIEALLVLILGWIVAVLIGWLISYIVRTIQLDKLLESIGFKRVWERSGYQLNSPKFFGEAFKWFFVIIFVTAATKILNLTEVTDFLTRVIHYIPNVFIAAAVMLIGILVARFMEGVIKGSAKVAEISSSHFAAVITKWAVIIFSLSVALDQLEVAAYITNIAVTGIVAAVALAIGLSFGLGGKSHAEEIIGNFRRKLND